MVLPIHVLAFTALYLGNSALLKEGYAQAGAAAARRQIEQLVREMPTMMPATRGAGSPHLFGHLLSMHQPIGLRLYSAHATLIWPHNASPEADEVARVRDVLADETRRDAVWIERSNGQQWVRGVVRVRTGTDCQPCHEAGRQLGAASIRIDFTDEMREMQSLLRRRLELVFGCWIALVGIVAVVVRYTVRRSLTGLETDLNDAAAGRAPSTSSAEIPLDPASAAFYGRLRDFLRRQRAREAEVVSRLAHVNQLASLGELSAGLAHEIKNPLAGIQGALEVLKHEAPDDSTTRLYDEMLGELQRVNGILQRLLESGRPAPLRLSRTNPGKLLAETAELLQPALARRKVEIRAHDDGPLPEILLDPAKIRQVLLNLVQNASEAMGEKGGRIDLRARALAARREIVLAVEDDGPGIPAADREHLFEPFFTTKFTGTGLGLAISKSLVEQHGGRIEIDSAPGRGTTFFVFLSVTGPAEDPPAGGKA
ncbi:MAG TPA: ATP-binding protein [Thermoanaerobaculia bacterium]|nr:ATP-binding protein [Thermoanaerobaculia bacterium]